MANIALIRGAAMAAPRYNSWKGALQEGLKDYKNFRIANSARIEREKIAYQKIMAQRAKEVAGDMKNVANFNPNELTPAMQQYAPEELIRLKEVYYKTAVENAGDPRKQIKLDGINNQINSIVEIDKTLKQGKLDYIDRQKTTREDSKGNVISVEPTDSNVNDTFTLNFDDLRAKDQYTIQKDESGNLIAVFNPESFNQETIVTHADKFINGAIQVPLEDLYSEYMPTQKQTKRFIEGLEETNSVVQKYAKDGFNENIALDEIDKRIDKLNYSEEELMSIAVDEMGFEVEEKAGALRVFADERRKTKSEVYKSDAEEIIDLNDNGVYDELLEFVKDQYRQAAVSTYNKYKSHYEAQKTPDSLTAREEVTQRNEEITLQTFDSIINNPIKAIEQSGIPDKTEVRNNKITFYTPGEDGAKTINAQFDLKSKEGFKALDKYIIIYYYKSDSDLIYKINNYDITDAQINEIQKSFLANPVDPFNPNN
jgi:hypothetical protein